MNKKRLVVLFCGLLLVTAVSAVESVTFSEDEYLNPLPLSAEWSDDFDSYATGSALHGQGGWECWDNNPATTPYVTDDQARSTPNSVDIAWFGGVSADIVQMFTDINTGVWILTTYLYVPSTMTGNSDYILMNTYEHGVTHNLPDWSLQLQVSASAGTIIDLDNTASSLPLILDDWAEIRVEIDFDADWQTVYYDGAFLLEKSWSGGVSPGGAVNLACIDLYADSVASTSVYYDDFLLDRPQPLSCSAGGPYEAMIDEEIHFEGTAVGGQSPYEFLWDFGNGDTSTDEDPVYAYDEPGEYVVHLTVTDSAMTVASDETTATISGVPILDVKPLSSGLFKVKPIIKNIGTAEATDVDWSIVFDGGAFIGGETTGTIASIAPGTEAEISSGFVLGLGATTITVTAEIEDPGISDFRIQTGMVLLFFIKVNPGGG